jgi:CSLREA domain-containing protein
MNAAHRLDARSAVPVCFAVLSAGLALFAAPAFAATFNVNSTADAIDCNPGDGIAETVSGTGLCTLRAAIMEANAISAAYGMYVADAIYLPAGTYTLTIAGGWEDASLTGDLDITDDLTIVGSGQGTTIIDANSIDRVFEVIGATTSASLSGVTVTNGATSGDNPHGGGLRNVGVLSLTNCTFLGNTAGGTFARGGGMANEGGTATLTGCTFTANESGHSGGGMSNYMGAATLTDCTFSSNRAIRQLGGGLYSGGTATLLSCTFSGNVSLYSGGGMLGSGTFALTNCTFSANQTSLNGGALDASGTARLMNCTITGNVANKDGDTFGSGGGLYASSGYVQVGNTVIAGNTDNSPSGSMVHPDVSGVTGRFTSLGHNLIGDVTGSSDFIHGVNGDIVGTAAAPIDPLLGSLADNGGPTQTHALLPGSPALEAGDNALIANPPFVGPPYYDQRGTGSLRICDAEHDGTAVVDIGAYEVQNTGAPIANSDSYHVATGGALNVPAPGVLANDTDADGDSLTAVLVTGPVHGSLSLNANGSFTYTHDGGTATTDSFTYRDNDGFTIGSVGTATITIGNRPPMDILLSNATVNEGQPAGTAVGALTAADPDTGDSHTFSFVDGAGSDDNASFTIEAGSGKSGANLATSTVFVFEARGTYSVRVRADDGQGGVLEKAFTITVANLTSDIDGDGLSDTDELAAGTDPCDTVNPTSVMSLAPATLDLPAQGGTVNLFVTNEGQGTLDWSAAVTSGAGWLSVAGKTSGPGSGIASVSCTKNETGATRTGTIRVTAPNAVGSPADVTVTQDSCSTPAAPGNLQASDGTQPASVLVTWNSVPGASYEVFRGTESDINTAVSLGGTANTYFADATAALAAAASGCNGGAQNTVYTYWVVAFDACGQSEPSTPDTGYCGVAASKTSVYEDVLPSKAAGDATQAAEIDSPLAIRLRSDEPIDTETVWGTVACSSFTTEVDAWHPVSDTDGWVVYEPEDPWQFDEVIVFTVGAMTVSGQTVEPVTYMFRVESEDMLLARWDKDGQALWQPRPEDYAAMGMTPGSQTATLTPADEDAAPQIIGGAGNACVIGPDCLFDAPQWVWLPVPDGMSAGELGVFYFKGRGEDAGWYPADNVEGWLVPESDLVSEFGGVECLGFQVRHGGIVQLAPRSPTAAHTAAVFHGDTVMLALGLAALFLARRRAVLTSEPRTGHRPGAGLE